LARVPGLGPGDLTGAYLERDGRLWAVKVGPDGACAFFEPGLRACRIHGHKPLSCRTWPFYWAPLGSPGAFFEAKDVCPGLSAWDYPDFVAAFAATGAKAPPRSLKKALLGG
jgi:hypothetical protein